MTQPRKYLLLNSGDALPVHASFVDGLSGRPHKALVLPPAGAKILLRGSFAYGRDHLFPLELKFSNERQGSIPATERQENLTQHSLERAKMPLTGQHMVFKGQSLRNSGIFYLTEYLTVKVIF